MHIIFINKTEFDLLISIPNIPDTVLPSEMKKDIFYDTNFKTFSVKKQYTEFGNIRKFFAYILGSIIGFFLCSIYYSQIECLKHSVKFPVDFFVQDINCEEYIVELCSTSTLELCSAKINGTVLKSKALLSDQTLDKEIREYYESNITMYIIPFIIISILSVIAVANYKTTLVIIIAVAVNALLYIPILVIEIKNYIFCKKVRSAISADDFDDL